MEFPYKTTFAAKVQRFEPTDSEAGEVHASLDSLKGMLPYNIDPENEKDLLYIVGNLAVAGVVNKNDDALSVEDALQIYKKFEKKQCNIEHDRSEIVGFILKAGLSEFGTNRPISENEARKSGAPFNISTVAVLWKVANQALCNFIMDAIEPNSPNKDDISLSFEVGFSGYNIGLIPNNTDEVSSIQKLIMSSSDDFEEYNKSLRVKGGSGQRDGKKVFRLLSGDITPLGQGLVAVPAADVKGIVPILESKDDAKVSTPAEAAVSEEKVEAGPKEINDILNTEPIKETEEGILCRTFKPDLQKILLEAVAFFEKSFSHINVNNFGVSSSTNASKANLNPKNQNSNSIMLTLKEIKEKSTSDNVVELKETVANVILFAESIALESEKQAQEVAAEKARAADAEKAKNEVLAAAELVKTQFADVQKELAELKAKHETAAAEQKFNDRMNALDAEFEFEDDERGLLVDEIKALATDESFAAWMTRAKKLMKEKTKSFKDAKKAKDAKDSKDSKDKFGKKDGKKDEKSDDSDEDDTKASEALASAKDNLVEKPLDTTLDAEPKLADKYKAAFAASITIGGRTLEQIDSVSKKLKE